MRIPRSLAGRFSLRPRRREGAEPKEAAALQAKGGGLYALWLFLLPALLGLSLGWLFSVCLGVFLDRFEDTALQRQSAPGAAVAQEAGVDLEGFLAANPFRVSPRKPPVAEEKPEEHEVKITGSLAEAELRGTLPDVGAWLDDKGQLRLVLVGASFDVYTLKEVTYREAVFVKDDEVVVRELLYGPRTARSMFSSAPVAAAPRAQAAEVPMGEVVAAQAGGDEGSIPSEMVSQLVQNPFDELKKVRLRPKNGEAGLEIQWIQKDSILRKLGVQKGDVIRGINGIPFTNMADIANSINSLMSSERFDVEVSRKGKVTALRYVVH